MRSICVVKAFFAIIVLSICFFFLNLFNRHDDGAELANLMLSKKVPIESASSSIVFNDDKRNIIVGTLLGTPKTVVALSYDGEENTRQNGESKSKSSSLIQRVDKEDLMIKEIIYSPMILLSSNKSVISDVRGNLGPPSVITQELMEDWLKDRWQGKVPLVETMYNQNGNVIY